MPPRLLIIETSGRVGSVALALGDAVVGERTLDESRRHARDLVPAVQELMRQQAWRMPELAGVIVSRGPGSYTGLRVGIMSAKTLAYATGCALLAINTFDAIAIAKPHETNLDVIADAQQDHVYVQRFGTHPKPLEIVPFSMWLESALAWHVEVTGPGLEKFGSRLPSELTVAPPESWHPSATGLLTLGLERFNRGELDDVHAVEPLYLRASSAETKWAKLHPPT